MIRMADEPSVRGLMTKLRVLAACIKAEKADGPTETNAMKKVIRAPRHCITKVLVTMNPGLLALAQS
jgi:hypothetical protein